MQPISLVQPSVTPNLFFLMFFDYASTDGVHAIEDSIVGPQFFTSEEKAFDALMNQFVSNRIKSTALAQFFDNLDSFDVDFTEISGAKGKSAETFDLIIENATVFQKQAIADWIFDETGFYQIGECIPSN